MIAAGREPALSHAFGLKGVSHLGVATLPRGHNFATTRLRSVTSTVSPLAAGRTNSLSLFFNAFSPTERIS